MRDPKLIGVEPPHREDVVIDPREVPNARLGEDLWDKEDFEDEEECEEEQESGESETEILGFSVPPLAPAPTKKGWTANGWYIRDDGGGDPDGEDFETGAPAPHPVT